MKRILALSLALLAAAAVQAPAQQEFNLRITEGMPAVPFALPPFLYAPEAKQAAEEIQAVFEADIRFTRIFQLLPNTYYDYIRPLSDVTKPNFQEWRSIQAGVLFAARIDPAPSRGVVFEWYLYDVKSGTSIAENKYEYQDQNFRSLAHLAADDIMKAYGEKPIFSSRIAFVSNRDGNEELYLMDYDGANQTRLTYNAVNDSFPAWDPAGQRLAYTSWQNNAAGVYILDVNAKRPARTSVSTRGQNYLPAWSPDGKKLAFVSSKDGNHEIYVAEIEANPTRIGKIERLTFNSAADMAPCWSPTGREIVFTSDRGGTNQIYIMDAEGQNVRRISFGANHHDAPAWSPNGDKIVYTARVDNIFDLYIYNVLTRQISKLTDMNARNESPSWSPDGRHIVFTSSVSGTKQVHVIDADGRNLRKLTSLGGNKLATWSN
jgi:TolB protein